MTQAAYEFFAGLGEEGQPLWTGDLKARKPVFEDPKVKLIGYNLKPMIHALYNHGISYKGEAYDLLIADYIM